MLDLWRSGELQLSKSELAAYAKRPEEPRTWTPDDALF